MSAVDLLNELAELQAQLDLANMKKQELIDAVITPEIKAQIADIDQEFAGPIETIGSNMADLTARIKEQVEIIGSTVKGNSYMAVWSKPRVSWDSKALDGMMNLIPQLAKARSEGQPSVSIRKI